MLPRRAEGRCGQVLCGGGSNGRCGKEEWQEVSGGVGKEPGQGRELVPKAAQQGLTWPELGRRLLQRGWTEGAKTVDHAACIPTNMALQDACPVPCLPGGRGARGPGYLLEHLGRARRECPRTLSRRKPCLPAGCLTPFIPAQPCAELSLAWSLPLLAQPLSPDHLSSPTALLDLLYPRLVRGVRMEVFGLEQEAPLFIGC